jgi:uncharacterized protein YecE (DUF72 family)
MTKQRKNFSEPSQLELFAPAETTPSPPPASRLRRATVGPQPLPPELEPVAAALPSTIRLGTSSWSFHGWEGIIYDKQVPQTRLAKEGLLAYAQHPLLGTVGVDRTYYAPISAEQFAAYAAQVPDTFRFLVKAHDFCTTLRFPFHPRYGARKGQVNNLFLDAQYATENVIEPFLEGLQDKAGPLLFQFPPQDYSSLGSPEQFAERLHTFLDALPRGPLYAIEVRNPEVLTTAYAQALSDTGACHCLNGHPRMSLLGTQAQLAQTEDAPALVIRWMLARHLSYEAARDRYAPFNRLVDEDPDTREAIADLCIDALIRQRPAFVIANNKAEGSSPLSLFRLAERIVGKLPTDS